MIKMENKPILAIIGGTGNEGPGLALRWAYGGYKVIIGSRNIEKAQSTAAQLNQVLGITNITGLENQAAARVADISVLTVQHTAHQQALIGLGDSVRGKILVDATARVDFRDPKPPVPPAAARLAQALLGPEVSVVAAFQNVPAHSLKKNIDHPLNTDVLVCSDNMNAARQVIQLARGGGMQAFYAGGLDNAIIVEGITAMLLSLNKSYGSKNASIHIVGVSDLVQA
jgi:NADPH-dependent F420 reductase